MDETDKQTMTGDQVAAIGLVDWRPIFAHLDARFATGSFVKGLELAARIGELAEAANHHPDLDLRYGHLEVRLTSHDVGGMTRRDVALARQISAVAADMGIESRPGSAQTLEIALDTWDVDEIRPFWAAVYGVEDPGGDEVVDADGRLPALWFQSSDTHDQPRMRFHLDLRVPPEVVQARMDAALAAGGLLVTDDFAPRWWVLADPQGNKICLTTHQTRTH